MKFQRWWHNRGWLSLAWGPTLIAMGTAWDDNIMLVLGGIILGGDLAAILREGWRPGRTWAREKGPTT